MSARHAPTFDTAAFTAEELASASVCGLPDCVPGGCGGLIMDAAGVAKVAPTVVVTDGMVEAACDAWAAWHTEGGWAPMNGFKPMRAALTAALSNGETP